MNLSKRYISNGQNESKVLIFRRLEMSFYILIYLRIKTNHKTKNIVAYKMNLCWIIYRIILTNQSTKYIIKSKWVYQKIYHNR